VDGRGVTADEAALDVRDLHVSFPTPDGVVRAVRGASFQVEPGSTLAIVGESGSGKSVCARTLLGLHAAADVTGEAWFGGRDLLAMSEDALRRVRGAQISMIFQDPLTSLHPLHRVGWQITEAIGAHQPVTRREARARAVELLGMVGIPRPASRVDDYPHQFSGGMRQRAMIAMALALRPSLIIADEPTTALDATVQAQILQLLQEIQREQGTALLMITHDLAVVAGLADTVGAAPDPAVAEPRADRGGRVRPADPGGDARRPRRGLHPHRHGQGPDSAPGHPAPPTWWSTCCTRCSTRGSGPSNDRAGSPATARQALRNCAGVLDSCR
jgi:peptide/nickel transport system ATP-binding protein